MRVLMTLVLLLLLAGCAAGQGDGATSGTTQKETIAKGTEETTVFNEESTFLGFPEPPDSTLSFGEREIKGTLGSYCWSSGNSSEYVSTCLDSTGPPIGGKQETLTVPTGSEMVFRYGGQDPPKTVEAGAYSLNKLKNKKGGVVNTDRSLEAQGSGVQRTIPAKLPPGEYVLDVFVKVQEDDATYYFRILAE
jgi:hypothetical protein